MDTKDQVHFVHLLYSAVYSVRPQRIVQTGTFTGVSLVAMLLGALDRSAPTQIVTIDPEPDNYFTTDQPVKLARDVIRTSNWQPYVQFLHGYSGPGEVELETGNASVPESNILARLTPSFDMAVIDGDHSFRGALTDLNGCHRILRSAGPRLIFVHDYNGIPEVRAAVDFWRATTKGVRLLLHTPWPSGVAVLYAGPVEK